MSRLFRRITRLRPSTKTLRVMKVISFFLFVISIHVSGRSVSQTITLNVKDMRLREVFTNIEKQTGLLVFYNRNVIKSSKPVTISAKNMPLADFMMSILKDEQLDFSLENKTIFIKSRVRGSERKDKPDFLSFDIPPIKLRGKIVDEKGEPLAGVSVRVSGTNKGTTTNDNGEFALAGIDSNAMLQISAVNIEPFNWRVGGKTELILTAKSTATAMGEVTVTSGNTGYQVINKSHPGSFDVVDNKLFNRRVSTDIISRIENLTPGVTFRVPGEGGEGNPLGILIRGRNSIFSATGPLIVVDNFPYDGDLNNINPNDVENITILKDAASAAQWGARAGNGVIIITTKRGRSSKPQVALNNNITFVPRPDYSSLPVIASAEYIELEKWLFNKAYYDFDINNTFTHPPLTPVVEILERQRNNEINSEEANKLIESYKSIDARNDLEKYFYRTGYQLQNSLNVSGNTPGINYYLSVGWDKNLSNIVGQRGDRITLRTQNSFKVTDKFKIDAGINYTQFNNKQGSTPAGVNSGAGKGLYPYADLVDDAGNPMTLVRDYRSTYTDTAGYGALLDWKYKPYDEIKNSENKSNTRDFMINGALVYRFSRFLTGRVSYQFQNSVLNGYSLDGEQSYSARNLINQFYQPAAGSDALKFPVPIGGIITSGATEIISHQARAQLDFNHSWNNYHKINAIAGYEIKNLVNRMSRYMQYGYNREGSVINTNMDFVNEYVLYPSLYTGSPSQSKIPNIQGISETLDRFLSYYVNGNYTFKDRYTVSASSRTDAANLFGVETNQRGVPLWSVGTAWTISKERFFNVPWLPYLKLRTTYGRNGNFSRTVSAITTITYSVNNLGATQGAIVNPPNKNLKWEQVSMWNVGLDFSMLHERVSGSIEYYRKSLRDLMGRSPIDPTTGLSNGSGSPIFYGNLAGMKGKGYELNVTTKNINGAFNWTTNILFSYAQNRVSEYLVQTPTSAMGVIGAAEGITTPIIGKPLFTLYRFPSAGLDPATGDPLGYYDKSVSKDYDAILNSQKVDSLVYFGAIQPPVFGSIMNSFSWKNFSISVNVSYKLRYYFQRNNLSYAGLYSSWTGHSDYSKRWQKPGDEIFTDVPSRVYIDDPAFGSRETFYFYSETLIEKGDHIRLEDISLSYSLNRDIRKRFPFSEARLYAYASNLGVNIWKANDNGIDPYLNGSLRNRINLAFGINLTF